MQTGPKYNSNDRDLYFLYMRILVVEDDDVIAERLRVSLGKEGYHVDVAMDGEEGLFQAEMSSYGVVILDIMMPKKNGIEVCQTLRRRGVTTPILMLTARDTTLDKITGLDAGADDYLPKPFDFNELKARVRALLRREKSQKSGVIEVADLQIDTVGKTVRRAGELVHLTPREYSLLEALARNEGRTLTRDIIIDHIWADDDSLSNTVNFHVTSLRKKIDAGRERPLIHTVHGFGYSLRSASAD